MAELTGVMGQDAEGEGLAPESRSRRMKICQWAVAGTKESSLVNKSGLSLPSGTTRHPTP